MRPTASPLLAPLRLLRVRRQYIRIAGQALKQGRFGWFVRQAIKTAAVPLSERLGRPLSGPIIANLMPTYRCNNRCIMCDLPKTRTHGRRGTEEMDTAAMKRVIDDLAAIGTSGLSFSGGEPTLRSDCMELLGYAEQVGLFVHLNTNAWTLTDAARVDALLATGVASVNFSLDGSTAATHDRLRGAPGSFARVAKATELVLARRRGRTPTLTYVVVVGPANHHELPDLVALARRRGIDSVSFMPLHGTYGGAKPPSDVAPIERTVEWLRAYKREPGGDFIDSSDEYLSLFGHALRGEPSPLRCYVGYDHIQVDCYGNIYPCFFWYEMGHAIGNTHDTPLRDFWRSEQCQAARIRTCACHDCYWNCHTEMNLLYDQAPRRGRTRT